MDTEINSTEYSPSTLFLLPLFGHHPNEFPWYKDCFTRNERGAYFVVILTHTGPLSYKDGDTDGVAAKILYDWMKHRTGWAFMSRPHEPDQMYTEWLFSAKDERWRSDFELLANGYFDQVSSTYKHSFQALFPDIKYDDLAKEFLNKLKHEYSNSY